MKHSWLFLFLTAASFTVLVSCSSTQSGQEPYVDFQPVGVAPAMTEMK